MSKYKALILAGGSGTRLWPLSRNSKPKQVITLWPGQSLLRATYERLIPFFDINDIWLATSQDQAEITKSEVLEIKNFSLEPVAKNTAPAIGLAVLRIWLQDPEASVVTINSDHHIKDIKEYLRILKLGEKIVAKYPNSITLIGIKTEHPETGYGYVATDKIIEDFGKDQLWQVKRFVEKPDLKLAENYHEDHRFLWNPAIFIFRAQYMLDLFKQHLPQHYDLLMQIKDNIDDDEKVAKIFSQMEVISIDYGIMEQTKDLLVLPASFGWSDIGSWRAVYDVLKDKEGNAIKANNISIDSRNNLIYSTNNKLISTVGIANSIIINTDDALLVARVDKTQEVKHIIEELKKKSLDKYL